MKTINKTYTFYRPAAMLLALIMLISPVAPVVAAPVSKNDKTPTASSKSSSGKGADSKKKSSKGSSSSGKKSNSKSGNSKTAAKQETSADLKKRQQSAQAEVRKTEAELKQNEAEVKKSLNELSILEDGIATSKKETDALSAEVGKLNDKISSLEKSIAEENAQLANLRSEYLKAVKKMRVSRKRNSKMAYLFSSKNLAEAERRMRYLKEFSDWKEKKIGEINKKVAKLKKENEELLRAKSDKDVMLGREMKAQKKLNDQKQQQDKVVAELRANGDALKSHLAKKQAEVDALKGQVASLIADEQRKAEAEKKRKDEAAKAERAAAEKKAAEAAKKKEEEEAAAKKKAEESKDKSKKEAPKKEEPKKDTSKKETPKKETPKKEEPKKESSGKSGDYAEARKRKPRGDKDKGNEQSKDKKQQEPEPKKETAPKDKTESGFASAKGSLPRPVDGAFRVTGKFGRHALPDLPDVTYDNPGIDVEVSKGATVKCVYEGTVSGVYVVPGFGTVVIVNHGDYYTVYGNLSSASVSVGNKVTQGKAVGKLAEDPDNPGHSTLHFEVWKGREKTNPQSWIR